MTNQPPQAPDAEVALRQRMEDARPEMQQILKEDLAPGGWFEQREIAEIAKRHDDNSYKSGDLLWCHEGNKEDDVKTIEYGKQAHLDRATLLRLLASRQPGLTEDEREEIAAIKGALEVAADINVDPLFAIIERLTGQPAGETK